MEKHLILLHGALGSKAQFDGLLNQLEGFEKIHAFNFMGHGGDSLPATMWMPQLVIQLENYINQNIPQDTHLTLFGYSMGGYAALLLASQNHCKIDGIITLGTKLEWNPAIAAGEADHLKPSLIKEKVPAFAEQLKNIHHPQDWEELLRLTSDMMLDLGANQYLNDDSFSKIKTNCKLLIGEKDKMVSQKETINAAEKIINAKMKILPNTPHPIEKVMQQLLKFEIATI